MIGYIFVFCTIEIESVTTGDTFPGGKEMAKIRKPLIFTLCLIPVAAVGGWFTAQMSTASADKAALEAAVQQVGSTEIVMLITMIQTVVYAVICGFFGYLAADKIGLICAFRF